MFQNMRVDIIYYKTNTDFEMEFNLCGCCRMRLLTDKAPDRKTVVHALARAVSRSKIIMTVGPLFGDDGAIATVAAAIGNGLVTVNNTAYGIKTSSEIKVIEGATPLVTSDGFFGGLIIEKGNQTMILLSESKSVRKTIMEDLIHPYIAELYASELKGRADIIAPVVQKDDEYITDTESDAEQEVDENKDSSLNPELPIGVIVPPDAVMNTVTIADIMSNKAKEATQAAADAAMAAASVIPDINIDGSEKSATEAINERLIVSENDFVAANMTGADLLIGDEDEQSDEEEEEIYLDLVGEALITETEESTEDFDSDEDIELIPEIKDPTPEPVEVSELILEDEQSDYSDMLNINLPDDLLIGGEPEEPTEFRLPEEQRELLHEVTDEPEDNVPFLQHLPVEGEAEDFILDDNVAERKISRLNFPILVFTIILLLIIVALCYFMFFVPIRSGASPTNFIKEIFETLFP